MTRLLAEILGAAQPAFNNRLRQLEQASGQPAADIRLSVEILQRTQAKLADLGLDPRDSTAEEVYGVLMERLKADEQRFREYLGLDLTAASSEILTAIVQFERQLDLPRSCFALKSATAKRLLKQLPPEKTMSELGYRSIDSMLKHEPVAQIYVAARLYETPVWHDQFIDQYKALHPGDFENRTVAIYYPKSRRWEKVADALANRQRHFCSTIRELGATVVLPVTADVPAFALTGILLLLDSLNTIRCASTYLKLQQVGVNFGAAIKLAARGEPSAAAALNGQALPWRVVQAFFYKVKEAYHPALFEPHVQPEDIELAEAEQALTQKVPALSFWEDCADLAYTDNGAVVSLNMLDVALNAANNLEFNERLVAYARDHIWSSLITRYLTHCRMELVEQLSEQLNRRAQQEVPA